MILSQGQEAGDMRTSRIYLKVLPNTWQVDEVLDAQLRENGLVTDPCIWINV